MNFTGYTTEIICTSVKRSQIEEGAGSFSHIILVLVREIPWLTLNLVTIVSVPHALYRCPGAQSVHVLVVSA